MALGQSSVDASNTFVADYRAPHLWIRMPEMIQKMVERTRKIWVSSVRFNMTCAQSQEAGLTKSRMLPLHHAPIGCVCFERYLLDSIRSTCKVCQNLIESQGGSSLTSSEYQVELFLLAWAVFLAVPWAVMNVRIFSCDGGKSSRLSIDYIPYLGLYLSLYLVHHHGPWFEYWLGLALLILHGQKTLDSSQRLDGQRVDSEQKVDGDK
jgi:hypothetical protein